MNCVDGGAEERRKGHGTAMQRNKGWTSVLTLSHTCVLLRLFGAKLWPDRTRDEGLACFDELHVFVFGMHNIAYGFREVKTQFIYVPTNAARHLRTLSDIIQYSWSSNGAAG